MLVIIMPDKVRRSYKLSLTPTTMVIASDGTVEKVWAGKWSSKVAEEAGSFLGCHFSQNQGKIN
jgi:peroxiredoxin